MKLLIIAAAIFFHTDTAKVRPDIAIFKNIEKQEKQIKSQVYTTNDVYSLLIKQGKILNKSHELTRLEIIANDSISHALSEQKGYIKAILTRQDELRADIRASNEETEQLHVLNRFMDKSIMLPFFLIVIYIVMQIFYEVTKKRLKHAI